MSVLVLTMTGINIALETPILPVQIAGAVAPLKYQADVLKHLAPIQNNFATLPLEKPSPPPPPDCSIEACVALTFDDGPDAINTPKIMDVLNKEQVKATFFLVGNKVVANGAIVQRMYREGFEVGNHSWSHPDLTKLNPQQIRDQVNQTQNAIVSLGLPAPTLFRPPYGLINKAVIDQIRMPIIRWNVDPKDWRKADPAQVITSVETQVHPGALVILHSTKPATAAAADTLIKNLKTRFRLVTVTQLLNLAPGT